MTIVNQLVTDARTRFGAHDVEAVEVSPDLLDRTMDHVLALGGEVGIDYCVVDGVRIVELPQDQVQPRARVRGEDEPRVLTEDAPQD